MASDQTLRAIITVLDRTAEPIHQINNRFNAMGAPLREVGSRISELAEEVGLKRIGEHAREAFAHVRELGASILEMAGPLAALGAAGSVAGLVEIAKSTAEFAERLDISAMKTGLATEQLAGWHYAAGLVNVDVARLDKGFTFLNRNINEAAAGRAKDVEAILTRMGFHNTPGHLVSTAEALKAVAAEAKHLTDGGQIQLATDMMAKLFGARAGADLLPLFEQGPEALAKALERAQEAGISLTAGQTASGHEFMEQYKAMSASVEGLKIAIGNELFPILTPAIEGMRELLNEKRVDIARGLGDAVHTMADTLRDVDWRGLGQGLRSVAEDAAWVVREVGGIGPAIGILAAVSLAPTIAAFAELGGAVAMTAGKFLLFPAAEAIAMFAGLVPAIGGVRDVFAALDLVMAANPIGLVVAGAAALVAVAYEVYEHWDKVVHVFERVGQAFSWFSRQQAAPLTDGSGGFIDKDSGMYVPGAAIPRLGAQPPLPSPPGTAAAQAAPGAQGQTKVTIDFRNLPPGATVSTESRGSADAPDINVGRAWALQ